MQYPSIFLPLSNVAAASYTYMLCLHTTSITDSKARCSYPAAARVSSLQIRTSVILVIAGLMLAEVHSSSKLQSFIWEMINIYSPSRTFSTRGGRPVDFRSLRWHYHTASEVVFFITTYESQIWRKEWRQK